LVLGQQISGKLGGHANIIGGALLSLTGLYVLGGALKKADKAEVKQASRGFGKLLLAGLALSIDNLIVGFGLGTHQESLLVAALVIGITSVGLSLIGLELGSRLSSKVEEYSEVLSGLILILVGLAIGMNIL
jgi:putative Mn2+ efflux pump MntP